MELLRRHSKSHARCAFCFTESQQLFLSDNHRPGGL